MIDVREIAICVYFSLLFFFFFQAEHSYKMNPKILIQLQHCEETSIPWAVIIGEDELKRGVVTLRHVPSRQEEEVKRESLVDELKNKLRK